METGLARTGNGGFPASSMAEVEQMGKLFERSGMFGCSQEGQGVVLAATCLMARMTPLEFMQTYHLLDGKPSMRADAMLAKLLELGGSYKILSRTDEKAAVHMRFKDADGEFCLTWEDAKKEPFVYAKDGKSLKKNWATPRIRMQMLWARCVSDAVRTVCPMANKGSYAPEEIGEPDGAIPVEVAVTAETVPAAPVAVETGKRGPGRPKKTEAATAVIDAVVVEKEEEEEKEKGTEGTEGTKAPMDAVEYDFNLMPCGRMAGQAWAKFTVEQLQAVLTLKRDEIKDGHKAAVREEIERRTKGGAA